MKNITLVFIFLSLLLVPIIANGRLYYLGGDDMRLYYLYPHLYLKNYVFNLIGGNTLAGANTGYQTVAYYAPFFAFLSLLKFIPINTQFLMFGLNLSLGFLFFYMFLGLYIKNDWLSKTSGSLFYILSPFLIATFYRNQMISMYLISLIPICLFLFIKSVREKRYYLSFLSAVIFSVFSTTLNTIPWWAAFIIPTFIFLLTELRYYPKQFIISFAILTSSFVIANSYWLFNYALALVEGIGPDSIPVGDNTRLFINDNMRVMRGVSTLFSPINVMFVNLSQTILNKSVLLLNSIYIMSVIIGMLAIIKSSKKTSYILNISLVTFLVSWFLFSPNLGKFSLKIFLYMGENIPMFGMFRNMYDKFSLPLAFYFAFVFAFSLSVVRNNLSSNIAKFLVFISLPVTIFNAKDFLMFKYTNTEQLQRVSGVFSQDYLNLVKYFNDNPNKSKVLWLPLNFPTYSNIEDANNLGRYYSGLSPLRIMADRSDYAGGFSFITADNYFVSDYIWQSLKEGKFSDLGELFQKMNAKYLVVDKQNLPAEMLPFLYGGQSFPLLKYQNETFYREILGSKLANFGRYEVYNINNEYDSEVVYQTADAEGLYRYNSNVKYTKVSSTEYSVTIDQSLGGNNLVLLESFNTNWRIYLIADGKKTLLNLPHSKIFGYANMWHINSLVNHNYPVKLLLVFEVM